MVAKAPVEIKYERTAEGFVERIVKSDVSPTFRVGYRPRRLSGDSLESTRLNTAQASDGIPADKQISLA